MLLHQIKTKSCHWFFLTFNVEAITNSEIYLIWKKEYMYAWEEIFLECVCFNKLDEKCHYKWNKHTCSSLRTVKHIAYIDKILYQIGFIRFFLWKWTWHPINIDNTSNIIIRDSAFSQLYHVIGLDLQITKKINVKFPNTETFYKHM